VADWYYIGHYGQLGPLTREQIDELVQGGVIARDTYVWYTGMNDWLPAERCPDLLSLFASTAPTSPPPPPSPRFEPQAPAQPRSYGLESSYSPVPHLPMAGYTTPSPYGSYQPAFSAARSDKSRALGGILNLIIPGVGRMYLGYGAIGALQLMSFLCFGVGFVWSFIDGILILTGGLKFDGYGRELPE
jgi:TM2 domain-containing membrane protein YozV